MRPVSLFYFARVKPLAGWSISGSLLGVALAIYLAHGDGLDVIPMILAAIAVILMQYVAHPMNDIMDYDLDRQAPMSETGRIKPLVDGIITQKETKWLTVSIVLAIIAIISYLIWLHPVLILPASYGMAALVGYNHRSFKLAYKPYSELYLSMPINAIAVFVLSYIGSGQLSLIAAAVSISFGFASSSFFVSMMSMDFPTDRKNDKRTTVVVHPGMKWCEYYPLLGLAFAIISTPFIADSLGFLPTTAYLAISVAAFVSLAVLGRKVDAIRLDYLTGNVTGLEGLTGAGRLNQLYLSVVYSVTLTSLFIYIGT
jgi:1,4-dihydroxy-2-naphthoate octaprenyltransferase